MTNLVSSTKWTWGKWYIGRRWVSFNEVEHSYGFLKKRFVICEVVL